MASIARHRPEPQGAARQRPDPAEPPSATRPEPAGARFAPVAVPGLTVGSAHDPAEAEADRVSQEVLQRLGAASATAAAPVRRRIEPEVGIEGGSLSPGTRSSIEQLRGAGSPLPEPMRTRMEGAFGADFSDVRVHTGDRAARTNQALGALAFTTGNDIVLGQGSSIGDQRLLAHELTHVVQNRG